MTKFFIYLIVMLLSICRVNPNQIITGNPVHIIDITAAALSGKWEDVYSMINRHLEQKYKLHLMNPLFASMINLPPGTEKQVYSAVQLEKEKWLLGKTHRRYSPLDIKDDNDKEQKKSPGYRYLNDNSTEAENDFDPEIPHVGYYVKDRTSREGKKTTEEEEDEEEDDEDTAENE